MYKICEHAGHWIKPTHVLVRRREQRDEDVEENHDRGNVPAGEMISQCRAESEACGTYR
jgi:hypothetical protein